MSLTNMGHPMHSRDRDPPRTCSVQHVTKDGAVTEWFVRLPGGMLVSCGALASSPEIFRGSEAIADWLCDCINEWRR